MPRATIPNRLKPRALAVELGLGDKGRRLPKPGLADVLNEVLIGLDGIMVEPGVDHTVDLGIDPEALPPVDWADLTGIPTPLTDTTAAFTTAQESKLAGIASGATANSSDAALLDRANHTGTQTAATISDFIEASQDVVGAMVVAAGGSYDDAAGTMTLPGGSDPWTNLKLALDYNNALNTFATITDGTTALTFTPPANTDWALDARLLIWTTVATNLPRIGVAIGSGASRGYGGVNIWSPGATATTAVQANGAWNDAAGVTVVQIAAGGVLTASVPYVVEVVAHGRSGASPTAISLQMACETAAAATCFVKRGSWMRWRTI